MSAKKRVKRSKAERDRRTNIINGVLVAVFVLAILAFLCWSRGWYLPLVTALSTDGYDMNAVTFNYFYRDTYDSFRSAYGEMLDAQGTIKPNVPLDEQTYSADFTWADFFYDTAVETAKRTVIVYEAAQEAGYELSEDAQAEIDAQLGMISANANANGYSTAAGFLRGHYGAGATMKTYRDYLEMKAISDGFSGDAYSGETYAEEELAAWFEENYPDAGDAYNYSTVDFRMIYLPYSGYAYDADTGYYGYSDEAKQSAKTQLQTVATLYVQGEQTEESFAALAEEYSSYNRSEGGLYENAMPDDENVEAQVRSWLFTDGRKAGDTDYIEADSGVYLLYWVGENQPAWRYLAEKGLRTESWNAWYEELAASVEFTENPSILKHLNLDP